MTQFVLDFCMRNYQSAFPRMETETVKQDFTKKTWREDVTLVVEGKKLYVAKNILAIISPVFEAMFSHPFSEKDKKEVELPGKEFESFREFLKCVYPNSETEQCISARNIFQVLPLADEYQVKMLKDKCEKYLRHFIGKKDTKLQDILKCLAVAERYNLNKIKDICRDKIQQKDPEEVVKADVEPICRDTMLEVMKQIVLKQSSQLELVKMYIHEDLNKENSSMEFMNFQNAKGTVLKFAVSNVSARQKSLSPATDLWGFQFSILVKYTTTNSVTSFGFFLVVEPPPNTEVWSCRVKARLVLKSENMKDLSRVIEHTFTAEEDDWGFSSFYKMSDILNPDLGFIRNDKIQLAVVILADEPETD